MHASTDIYSYIQLLLISCEVCPCVCVCLCLCAANIYGFVQRLLHLEVVSKYAANQGQTEGRTDL